jgi:hypothetical protein
MGPGLTPIPPKVKVCPHCAEELPDEATVCSNCLKDPAVAPAWAAPKRPDEPSPRLGDVFGPNGVLPTSDRVPPFKGLERARAFGEVPSTVWLSLILWLFGRVAGFGLSSITGITGPILAIAVPAIGLILGIVGRSRIKSSNGQLGGLALANIAIALHLLSLVWLLLSIGPLLQTLLAR